MSQILIVDDEPQILDALEDLLVGEGHQVRRAQRAEQAIWILERESHDLVVMDISMPGISGLEALRQIKASHSRLPVILMTAQLAVSLAVQAGELGAFDYHVKPLHAEEVLASVDRALAIPRSC